MVKRARGPAVPPSGRRPGGERMDEGLLILDGGLGTELARRGVDARGPLFGAQALLDARGREVVREVHRAYVAAGARVITAATFRTARRSIARGGVAGASFPGLAQAAVRLAREAASGGARVAGSIAPLEDCYRPERAPGRAAALREHGEHARALAAAGCEILLVETVCAEAEGLAAVEACASAGLPVWVSAVAVAAPGREPSLLDGADLAGFFRRAREAGAQAALVNCTPCDAIDAALPAAAASGLPWGAYAHLGEVDPALPWPPPPRLSPDGYRARVQAWVDRGASIVGGCCGTGPDHIAALARLAAERRPP